MSYMEAELSCLGETWLIKISSGRGGFEKRVVGLEGAHAALTEGFERYVVPAAPRPSVAPAEPVLRIEAAPRFARHAPRENPAPSLPAPEPPMPQRVVRSKKEAAKMRVAADERGLAALSPESRDAVVTRRAQASRRRA